MLPRADIITVNPVGRAESLGNTDGAGDARQEAFQRSLAGLFGKALQGEILSKLTDGSYIVRVAGAAARMQLPAGAQVGGQVPLTLVALSPRPTFQISAGQGHAYAEAAPALLLPGPEGRAARGAPLVYLDGADLPHVPGEPRAAAAPGPRATPGAPGAQGAQGAPGAPAPATSGAAAAEAAPHLPSQAALLPGKAPIIPAERLPAIDPKSAPASPAAASAANGPALPGAAASAEAAPRTLSHAAMLLGKAPIIPADQLPAIDPKSTPASLSEAGRVITGVLTAALKAEHGQVSSVARTPLVDAPTAAPEQLAAALKAAVGKSGLFYESHLAEWSEGRRSISELRQEPQMQRALAMDAGARQQGATDPALAQLINLQLATQEQSRVAWQGQLWPGQQLHWEISKDAPEGRERQPGGEPAQPLWRSALRLRFALLGELEASVVMTGEQLHIQIQAGSSGIGRVLREHASALGAAMEAASIALSSLSIGAPEDGSDG